MDSRKILIVEDEMITALDLQTQLHRMGYQVSALVQSGEEAVRLAQELHPDLVLMDVSLAGAINGIEASRRIRENQHIPIVYLTAYSQVFLRNLAPMPEPGICLSKPFSFSELRAVVQVALAS